MSGFFDPVYDAIAQRIAEEGLSKRRVASRAGVSPSTVQRVLDRNENAYFGSLLKVATAVGVHFRFVGPNE